MRKNGAICLPSPSARLHRGDAVLDFLAQAIGAHAIEGERMFHAVRADGVAFGGDALHDLRKFLGVVADQEIGRLHAMRGQDIEHLLGVDRPRRVIEREHHFLVGERQGLRILERADARMLGRIDNDGAAGADGVGIARTIGRKNGRAACEKQAECGSAKHANSPIAPEAGRPALWVQAPSAECKLNSAPAPGRSRIACVKGTA